MSVLEREGYIAQPHTVGGPGPDRPRATATTSTTSPAPASSPPPSAAGSSSSSASATLAMDELLRADEPAARRRHRARRRRRRPRAAGRRRAGREPRAAPAPGRARGRRALERLGRKGGRRLRRRRRPTTTSPTPSARFAGQLAGRRLADVADARASERADARRPRPPASSTARRAIALAARALDQHQSEPLYVGGASRLAAEHDAFVTTSTARLLELLEQHVVLASLMRELLGPGLTVSIGSENTSARSARVLARARAVPRRGRARRHRRRARPDAHGLPQGAGRGVAPSRNSSDASSRDEPVTR